MCILHQFFNKFYLKSPPYDDTLNIWISSMFNHLFQDVVVRTLYIRMQSMEAQMKLLRHSGLGHQSNTGIINVLKLFLRFKVSISFRKCLDWVLGLSVLRVRLWLVSILGEAAIFQWRRYPHLSCITDSQIWVLLCS